MVIYGWRTSHIKTEGNNQISCPHCGEKGGIYNSVYGRYVHIFWIPTLSIGKTGAAQCSHCKKVYKPKEMNDDLKRSYKTLKSDTRIPFWHFSGVAIIAIIIALFTINDKAEAQNELEYLDNPMIGDVYEYKADKNEFSTLKVVEVDEDSVYFVYNNYNYSQKSGIEAIDVDSCYSNEAYMVSREELKAMYNDGTIYDVNRK
ncbi:zinc-ribbon domain-containing protein [Carboxylicivirga sp. A043]|uniref:zinc ribbon domain-containing protein n=1 Tax=Carboxylicivirga litoralis TaxID=2816963 RepID=UPI0021CB7C85|nr:zinc ribbon domain-containing protein [Carboxylicivirga sp. A043]MCU4157290.1 zinc-ribbon domain-containing protein [Carboxylicivirga sp. A043]